MFLAQTPALAQPWEAPTPEELHRECMGMLYERGTRDTRPKWTRRGFLALNAGMVAGTAALSAGAGWKLYKNFYPDPVLQLSPWDKRGNGTETGEWAKMGARLHFVSLPTDIPLDAAACAAVGFSLKVPRIFLGMRPEVRGVFAAHQSVPLEIAERVAKLEEEGAVVAAGMGTPIPAASPGLFAANGNVNVPGAAGFVATNLGHFLLAPERDVFPMRWAREALFGPKVREAAAAIVAREPYRFDANVHKLFRFVTEAAARFAPANRGEVQAIFRRHYGSAGLTINHVGVRTMYALLLQSWLESRKVPSIWEERWTRRILAALRGAGSSAPNDQRLLKELRSIQSEAIAEAVEPAAEVALFQRVPVYFSIPSYAEETVADVVRARFSEFLPEGRRLPSRDDSGSR
jgi:hypothetical protein